MVDVLPTRDAGPLAAWLTTHPGVEIICRDRAGAYAEGARLGAPGALQVADRFHLWQGLGRAVETCVAAHRECLRAPAPPGPPDGTPPDDPSPEPAGRRADRKKAAHALVHELLAQGHSRRAIARHLGWGLNTVLRYARAAHWQDTFRENRPRPSRLDPYKPYLERRFASGCTSVTRLHRELLAENAPVTYQMVRAFIAALRAAPPQAPPPPPTVRKVTGWLTRHPSALSDMDPIHETHVREPGLVVVDVAAADDATVLAFQQLLADRWATAAAERTTRDAGQPGVRLRCYLDLRQQLTANAVADPTMKPTTARP